MLYKIDERIHHVLVVDHVRTKCLGCDAAGNNSDDSAGVTYNLGNVERYIRHRDGSRNLYDIFFIVKSMTEEEEDEHQAHTEGDTNQSTADRHLEEERKALPNADAPSKSFDS
mmetsp:Transcript_13478/g.29272  ORF Transcript_13478/g.29272 Transcript_13478/m.29272 type:complete len:113 (+) Transcript_13478:1812-2150(+)